MGLPVGMCVEAYFSRTTRQKPVHVDGLSQHRDCSVVHVLTNSMLVPTDSPHSDNGTERFSRHIPLSAIDPDGDGFYTTSENVADALQQVSLVDFGLRCGSLPSDLREYALPVGDFLPKHEDYLRTLGVAAWSGLTELSTQPVVGIRDGDTDIGRRALVTFDDHGREETGLLEVYHDLRSGPGNRIPFRVRVLASHTQHAKSLAGKLGVYGLEAPTGPFEPKQLIDRGRMGFALSYDLDPAKSIDRNLTDNGAFF